MAQFLNETLSDASGEGVSTEIDWPGGSGSFICQGTFNSATLQLQYTLDTGGSPTWYDVPGAELTIVDSDIGSFQLCPCRLIVDWSGGNSSTSVKVRVAPSWQGWFSDPAVPAT